MGFMAAAFILVWLTVAIYVVFMGLRQRRLTQEIQTLEELIKDRK